MGMFDTFKKNRDYNKLVKLVSDVKKSLGLVESWDGLEAKKKIFQKIIDSRYININDERSLSILGNNFTGLTSIEELQKIGITQAMILNNIDLRDAVVRKFIVDFHNFIKGEISDDNYQLFESLFTNPESKEKMMEILTEDNVNDHGREIVQQLTYYHVNGSDIAEVQKKYKKNIISLIGSKPFNSKHNNYLFGYVFGNDKPFDKDVIDYWVKEGFMDETAVDALYLYRTREVSNKYKYKQNIENYNIPTSLKPSSDNETANYWLNQSQKAGVDIFCDVVSTASLAGKDFEDYFYPDGLPKETLFTDEDLMSVFLKQYVRNDRLPHIVNTLKFYYNNSDKLQGKLKQTFTNSNEFSNDEDKLMFMHLVLGYDLPIIDENGIKNDYHKVIIEHAGNEGLDFLIKTHTDSTQYRNEVYKKLFDFLSKHKEYPFNNIFYNQEEVNKMFDENGATRYYAQSILRNSLSSYSRKYLKSFEIPDLFNFLEPQEKQFLKYLKSNKMELNNQLADYLYYNIDYHFSESGPKKEFINTLFLYQPEFILEYPELMDLCSIPFQSGLKYLVENKFHKSLIVKLHDDNRTSSMLFDENGPTNTMQNLINFINTYNLKDNFTIVDELMFNKELPSFFNETGSTELLLNHIFDNLNSNHGKIWGVLFEEKELFEKLSPKHQYAFEYMKKTDYAFPYFEEPFDTVDKCFDENGAKTEFKKKLFSLGKFEVFVGENSFDVNGLDDKEKKLIEAFSNIPVNNQTTFKLVMTEKYGYFNIDEIDEISNFFVRVAYSNSSEIRVHGDKIISQILESSNILDSIKNVENIFNKNNLPYVAKSYLTFDLLHPDEKLSSVISKDRISPVLKSSTPSRAKYIIYGDLLRCAFGSNNKNLSGYLTNLEKGQKLVDDISSGTLDEGSLMPEDRDILKQFVNHFNTLYNNTDRGKRNPYRLTGDKIRDIQVLTQLIEPTELQSASDRIVRMFAYPLGINNLKEAKQYMLTKVMECNKKNSLREKEGFKLEKGDLVKGINDVKYLENILQNGSVAREFLGDSAGSDLTPLDTDLSAVIQEKGSITDTLDSLAAGGYGSVFLIMKQDDRFQLTKSHDSYKTEEPKRTDKIELFQTGAIGTDHYGIRTGFASSEIDYILSKDEDANEKIKIEIAKNGFYIPIVDAKTGEIIFSTEDYIDLRQKMDGLRHYGIDTYDISDELVTPEIESIASKLTLNDKITAEKRTVINSEILEVAKKSGLELKTAFDGDVTPGSMEVLDTGSTGRGTNALGDGDFDFIVRVDREVFLNGNKDLIEDFSEKFITQGKGKEYQKSRDALKVKNISLEGLKDPVDIDLTFVVKTDKQDYSTERCVRDRLDTIKELYPDKYDYVVANIIYAKKFLKDHGCYKKYNANGNEGKPGGMGGVGVENWILQNGGSFIQASRSFLKASEGIDAFREFENVYEVWDFGKNHMAVGDNKDKFPHDNFVAKGFNQEGYQVMKQSLAEYMLKYEAEKELNQEELDSGTIRI